jgi:hypothetical protein
VKRFTTTKARSLAFGLFYTVMNIAALINGFAVDALRKWMCHGIKLPWITLTDGNRVVVASGAVSAAIALMVTFFLSSAVEEEALAHVGGVGGAVHVEAIETTGLVTGAQASHQDMHRRPAE